MPSATSNTRLEARNPCHDSFAPVSIASTPLYRTWPVGLWVRVMSRFQASTVKSSVSFSTVQISALADAKGSINSSTTTNIHLAFIIEDRLLPYSRNELPQLRYQRRGNDQCDHDHQHGEQRQQ